MAVVASSPVLTGAHFVGNFAPAVGGAMNVEADSHPILVNSIAAGNHTGGVGGGFNVSGSITLVNSMVSANTSDSPGGMAITSSGDATLRNTVFWGNTFDEIQLVGSSSSLVASHILIEGGCPTGSTCSSILDSDPLFVRNPDPGSDGEWGTDDDDYGDLRLQEGSPAIDFGLAEFLPPDTYDLDGDGDTEEPLPIDLDGDPRVQGNEVDLGAYESPFAVALEPGTGVPAQNSLAAAYPNPFRSATTLALDVAEAQTVTVEVFDVLGRLVVTVHDGPLDVGEHRVVIEAGALPAGVYVVRAEGESFRQAQRVTLVR